MRRERGHTLCAACGALPCAPACPPALRSVRQRSARGAPGRQRPPWPRALAHTTRERPDAGGACVPTVRRFRASIPPAAGAAAVRKPGPHARARVAAGHRAKPTGSALARSLRGCSARALGAGGRSPRPCGPVCSGRRSPGPATDCALTPPTAAVSRMISPSQLPRCVRGRSRATDAGPWNLSVREGGAGGTGREPREAVVCAA